MVVELRFFAGLRDYLPKGQPPHTAEFPDGSTVGDVFKAFGIPPEKPRIVLVNGRHADTAQVLHEGDVLSVFPPVAGG